jgi:hypothetical protein
MQYAAFSYQGTTTTVTARGVLSRPLANCACALAIALTCHAQGAHPVELRGRLIAADSLRPIANAIVTAISATRPPKVVEITTRGDGTFAFVGTIGYSYRICSEGISNYIDSCLFSKPLSITATDNPDPIRLTATPGIRVRIQVTDGNNILNISRGARIIVDPLDLLVYAEDAITRTRIPLPAVSAASQRVDYSAAIPAGANWKVAMNSVRAQLVDTLGRPYTPDTPIARTTINEVVAAFSVRAK